MNARMLVDLNERIRRGDAPPKGQEARFVRAGLAEEVEGESGLTVASYVDSYIAGAWKDEVPPEVEQFAANHATEIEAEFQRRAAPPAKRNRAKAKARK